MKSRGDAGGGAASSGWVCPLEKDLVEVVRLLNRIVTYLLEKVAYLYLRQ